MDRRIVTLISASALLAAIVVVVLVAGGGGDDSSGECAPISDDLTTKPVIEGCSDLPTELVSEDIVEGEGPAAKDGDTLEMDYVGVVTDTGEEFDTSWGKEPFEFELGSGGVIQGWDEGIVGMKVGGRRELIIPPDLAYGEAGSPPSIPANATLTFVVDLKSIK